METRIESDSLGPVEIPAERLWGAQTQRCLENFPIGSTRYLWGRSVIEALGVVKKAAALANVSVGVLDREVGDLILVAADSVIVGDLDEHFPLTMWQSGSGTQSNMNANEVIANRCSQLVGGQLGSHVPVHPNDHVNKSQSSNDVFPTVMHLAIRYEFLRALQPALGGLIATLDERSNRFMSVVKVGRTHLQDATPITVGQEMSGWVTQLEHATAGVAHAVARLETVTLGGTAVGTGLNAPAGFSDIAVANIRELTGLNWEVTTNHFAGSSAHDAVVAVSGALRGLAIALIKIGNDIRWLSSGPNNGIGELIIPANEPGSSIMPGKVNPSQIEALTMVSAHVLGNDATVAFAGSQGSFELNAYKPVMLGAVLDSMALLADACQSFDLRCARGLAPNISRINNNLDHNLMLVTALAPRIGYDAAARIAHDAHSRRVTLREAALASGEVSPEEYDAWVIPETMT